jgi:ElaB/YqjD/DUF883 family membrane-anchored ribosome-binding protein
MFTEALKQTLETGGQAVGLGLEAERVKRHIIETLDNSVADARRTLKRSRHAAVDLLDDTTYRVKQNPWQAVGLTLGLGFGIGALFGLLIGRSTSRCCSEKTT